MTTVSNDMPTLRSIVDLHLREVEELLQRSPSASTVRVAHERLRLVELAVETMAGEVADDREADRLLRLRDDLGSHLLAARVCEDAAVRPRVIADVLRRGATTMRAAASF